MGRGCRNWPGPRASLRTLVQYSRGQTLPFWWLWTQGWYAQAIDKFYSLLLNHLVTVPRHRCPAIISLRVTGKATSFNDLHICDVSSPEESKWSVMQADNPPPSRARHTAVVVRLLTTSLQAMLYLQLMSLFGIHVEALSVSSCAPKLT